MKHLLFLTGASSGIGKSLLEKYKGREILTFSRSEIDHDLHTSIDLSDISKTKTTFAEIFSKYSKKDFPKITLINNAAMLDPVHYVGKQDIDILEKSINAGFTSIFLITQLFFKYFQNVQADKRVIFISSGAALKPYETWSHYNSMKAGINMFARSIDREQERFEHPIFVSAFRPGVVDTKMQDFIREQKEENFPYINNFKALKEKGQLSSADNVADLIIEYLIESKVKPEVLTDAYEMG
jgi:benzil reductase ((S)-benzoin forming)